MIHALWYTSRRCSFITSAPNTFASSALIASRVPSGLFPVTGSEGPNASSRSHAPLPKFTPAKAYPASPSSTCAASHDTASKAPEPRPHCATPESFASRQNGLEKVATALHQSPAHVCVPRMRAVRASGSAGWNARDDAMTRGGTATMTRRARSSSDDAPPFESKRTTIPGSFGSSFFSTFVTPAPNRMEPSGSVDASASARAP